ncbi:MAG: hypothetical protein JWN03_5227 [Nocardia sp.]|uniref:hypothetical protein n=1 Tax=Nocardia sp. TaxID=1821 RepID=UPI00260ABCC1|nr:hypothetical protein [Nocardia sp.]MCU1644952.1 hypothetical protein [Nocardia sp.]
MSRETGGEITYERLIEVFNVLIAHTKSRSVGETVSIGDDYFWSVPIAEMNAVSEDPPSLTIGQISESWSNIETMLADDYVISYGLVWFADVLRAIAKGVNG